MIQRVSVMRWLRLVGSLKVYVSFAEYRLFHRAVLQEKPIILRSLPTNCSHPISVHALIEHMMGIESNNTAYCIGSVI